MRICHIITRLIVGGAQENTLLTCRGLVDHGHDVTLITGPQTGPEGSMHRQAHDTRANVIVLDAMRRAVHPLRDWTALRNLRKTISDLNPDVVHTHSSKAGIVGRAAARDANVPIVIHGIHGMSFNRTQPAALRWLYANLERYCAAFTDKFICVADAMTDQSVNAGIATRDRFVTIRSGIEVDRFDPDRYDRAAIRRRLGIPEHAIVVATIARLFKNKGYEALIPAMAQAVHHNDRLAFLWIGDGPYRQRYEQQLTQLGLRDRVHLTGLVPPDQVPELLGAADMLAHASRWEGLPRAAVQSLLMTKPVVVYDVDGAREVVIPDKTGVLVPLGDIDALAQGIIHLANDDANRQALGHAGRDLCRHDFDYRTMVDQIEHVYFQLAADRLTPPGTGNA